jgi:hypothetical protein
MSFNLRAALLLLSILFLSISLAGIVLAGMIRRVLGHSGLSWSATVSFRAANSDNSGQHYHTWNGHYSRSRIGYLNSPDRKVGDTAGICWEDIQYRDKQQDNCDIHHPGSAGNSTKVLLNYDVLTAPPTAVYYSGTFMPWASFSQTFPANSPALWVASSAGWSWYATCPTGGWIQNLMYVPYTGTMKMYEFYPDGTIKLYSYGFNTPGYKYIWFYADTPGRHMSLFTLFDKPSNYITIDVT